MPRPAGRKLALVMAFAFVVGLVGARAQYVAAASSSPRVDAPRAQQAVTDSSAINVSNLYDDLYDPTNPGLWCADGSTTTLTGTINGPYSGASADLPLNDCVYGSFGNGSDPAVVMAQQNMGDTWSCPGIEGPAGDADIDPSSIGLTCDYSDEHAIMYLDLNQGYIDPHTSWSTWALLSSPNGEINGYNPTLNYSVTGSDVTVTYEGNLSVTLSPAPTFTLDTSWAVITLTVDGSQTCLSVDGQATCEQGNGGTTGGISSLNIASSANNQPASDGYWATSEWAGTIAADVVAAPPTWADYGGLGCPRLASSACQPVDYNGTTSVPAACGAFATEPATGVDSSNCVYDNLSAYWFAMIGSIASEHQQPLTGGPITPSEEPFGNLCIPCLLNELATATAFGKPVNPEFGDMDEAVTDISIPGRGVPLQVARTYDTLNAATDGPLGYGWTSNLFMSLSQPGGTGPVTITQEGGAQVVFDQDGSGYTPAVPRDIATLTQNANGTWTFTRQAQDAYTFSSSGQLIGETDRNGYTTSLAYNASGQLTTVTDPEGRTLDIGWTGGNITSVTDPNVSPARVVTYEYDAAGDLIDVIDVNGGDTHYTYNASHQMTNIYDPTCYAAGPACNGGNGVVTVYNSAGQVTSQQDESGQDHHLQLCRRPNLRYGGGRHDHHHRPRRGRDGGHVRVRSAGSADRGIRDPGGGDDVLDVRSDHRGGDLGDRPQRGHDHLHRGRERQRALHHRPPGADNLGHVQQLQRASDQDRRQGRPHDLHV